MTGTILNVVTVLIGSSIGLLLGSRFPERIRQTVMAGLGIMTLIVGVSMAIPGNALIVLFSVLIGGIVGELLDVDGKLNGLGKALEARFSRGEDAGNFTKGFVTASLVFCVGPLTILGSIQDGLLGDYRLLAIKSLLDLFGALAFASTLGVGVAFAGITVLLVQGAISIAAMLLGTSLGEVTRETAWVVQMTATGGAVIIGISLLLLDLKRIRVANFTPAILIAPLITVALEYLRIQLPWFANRESARINANMTDLIIHSAAQLLTIAGNAPKRGEQQGELGIIENGAVLVRDGIIAAVGTSEEIRAQVTSATEVIDARGCVVLPGFVDAHTHVVFAGDRANEFEMRLEGAGYLEIMKAGGGIMSTVRKTRAATLEQIVAETRVRLDRMLAYGTTTVEAKTGYGLDTATELKQLGALRELDATHPSDVVPTFIGAHAIPTEYQGRGDAFVELVVGEMMERIAEEGRQEAGGRRQKTDNRGQTTEGRQQRTDKSRIPNSELRTPLFCDVFCDEGAFTLEQSRRILERGKELGMPLKIHADEFANLGGALLAAELGAVSADHLMVTRRDEMRAMAETGVIAVLLPGTTFGLGKHDFADGRAFVEENVAVALGTDLNPGTSWCESMPMAMAIATRYEKLTTAQAIVAATLNAAHASGVGERVGSLQVGKQGDILIADVPDYRYLTYRYGTNPIRTVVKRGRVVHNAAMP